MSGILRHVRANAVAYLALFVALGGTSYAAVSLPANSVGTPQIRNGAVTPAKLDSGKIEAYVRAWAVIQGGTKVIAARPRARVVSWDPSSAGGVVGWGPNTISNACLPLASGADEFVQVGILPGSHGVLQVHYGIFNNSGQPDPHGPLTFVTVLCP